MKLVNVLAAGAAVCGLFGAVGCQSGPQARSRGETERAFEFSYMVTVRPLPPEAKTLRLWVPVPQSDNYQDIESLEVMSPVSYELYREAEYGNQYAYLELEAEELKSPFDVTMRIRVRRREHKVEVPPTQAALVGRWTERPDLSRNLQPDRLVPLDGVVAALAEQEVGDATGAMEKARRVYDYVVSTMRYDKSGEGWGRGDALYACDKKRGNCTDFHSIFIGMLRVSGVPARFEIGFPLPPDENGGRIDGYHCWASFYADGLGWVPVDASEAWKHPEKREYFFGAHDEHRVLFTVGRDIRLDPAQQGEPLNFFIYPYAELDGKPVEVESEFSFRDLPARQH